MADKSIKFDMSNLNDLIKSLNDNYTLRVGIIGSKAKANHEKGESLTNAELGTFHEFGSSDGTHPPRRSFLEDSLKYKLRFNTEQMKKMRKDLFNQIFVKKNPKSFLQDLGAECLRIIEAGFATNGFGMWKPLASLNTVAKRYEKAIKGYNRTLKSMESGKRAYNKAELDSLLREASNPLILTDTGKLRRSIGFKVLKNGK